MGLMLKTPTTFIVFTIVYAFFNGFVYAAYAAVVLDAIGRKSAATNWNLLASFANIPIMLHDPDRGPGAEPLGIQRHAVHRGGAGRWPRRSSSPWPRWRPRRGRVPARWTRGARRPGLPGPPAQRCAAGILF